MGAANGHTLKLLAAKACCWVGKHTTRGIFRATAAMPFCRRSQLRFTSPTISCNWDGSSPPSLRRPSRGPSPFDHHYCGRDLRHALQVPNQVTVQTGLHAGSMPGKQFTELCPEDQAGLARGFRQIPRGLLPLFRNDFASNHRPPRPRVGKSNLVGLKCWPLRHYAGNGTERRGWLAFAQIASGPNSTKPQGPAALPAYSNVSLGVRRGRCWLGVPGLRGHR